MSRVTGKSKTEEYVLEKTKSTLSNAKRLVSSNKLVNNVKSVFVSLFGENDPLCYVCILLILVYVAIARPSNTPGFFRNGGVKLVILFLVAVVAHQNLLLGLVFGLAMVLTITYAHQNETVSGFQDVPTTKPTENGLDLSKQFDELKATMSALKQPSHIVSEEQQSHEEKHLQLQNRFESFVNNSEEANEEHSDCALNSGLAMSNSRLGYAPF